ncbi:4-aminobutyrate--2-oxoglutarate transaminase [Rubrobacter indicoceani]|uniref:4-aminobutyrate--2-oxoglutarate transaminase n=1 Tax=Rubrobacter indicoceani TaxID=2051957 RepID=UPI000E5B6986|nr:4-aminobutyrate--2-oxoglutarate transaminase [Rubrobacter indicoceani]
MLKSTQIKTEIPGPKSLELQERRKKAVSAGLGTAIPVWAAEAEGALVTDVDGNVFLDFGGGIGVLNAGHNHPKVVEAIKEQAGKLIHTCFYATQYEPYLELAEKLNEIAPGSFEKHSFLVNSGAEAVENAVKIARAYTGKPGVLAFENGFHGRTLLAATLTAKANPYKQSFGPLAPEVHRMPAPYPYRRPSEDWFEAFKRSLSNVDLTMVGCAIVEPVQGEGGFHPWPKRDLEKLAAWCRENDVLFIDDEVQSGFGRTGKMLAIEHYDVEPDLVTTAKSMGGGMPISGVTGRAEVMDHVHVGGIGTTYGGNPVSCAAALAVIEAFEEDNVLERAERLGERLLTGLKEIQHNNPDFVGDARGLGPMAGLEFVTDSASKTPDPEGTKRVVHHALENGLMLLTAGGYGNVIRTLMPLVITDEQLDEGLAILARAVGEAASEK